ncbi:MAG: ABC transporter transmembrane domain-containing protein [Rickettsiales bacterium]|nr:ABC transporter transmembrane domain-containing protein [Pseudomonadota bacterium]MDA0966155.1 ABC transporter transmembrane domain-containing protein [Pseudomonadota bacterium]MDG4543180.1 ABC transporter transmembrane domain-containing protein [Rickettsiales bacterium]MDG4545378.1 ABC transporter transmembrane domain-containing protein [Rickettsiales bacterium]MDG4547827.1 ABC transporter transmembrane domain-containing protein [Rickettsiales bacterium]
MKSSRISGNELNKADISRLSPVKKYLFPYKPYIIGAFIALLITSSSVLGLGKGLGYLIDNGLSGNNPELLNKALIAMMAITTLLALGTYARFYLITYTGERVISDIRNDIYNHILKLSPDFFEKTKAGDIISAINADCTLIQSVVGSSLSIALRNSIMLIGGAGLLIHTSPKLAGIVSIVIPMVLFPIILLGKKLRKASRAYQEKIAEISSHSEETIMGIKTIQAFVNEAHEASIFDNTLKSTLKAAKTRIRLRSLLTSIVILFVFGAVGFVLWIGGQDVLNGTITPGKLSSFIFYSVLVAGSTGALSEVIGDLQRAAGAADRIFNILKTQPSIKNCVAPKKISDQTKGDITFDNVTFSYPSKPKIATLKNVSFEIKNGETIAIVGHSGAGKSTIFNLLLRFYNTSFGDIYIDGIKIKDIELSHLRSLFGLVPQDTVIFSASAYDNILFGRPDATAEEVRNAAKHAAALDFIENLPEGFKSHLGEKGVRLSGGEKQRIAIARMFLKDPKILLLDEATSALDVENENSVQKAFESLMQERTTLVIAHRLSTVQKADKIIVFDKGEIVETGNHKTLMGKKGVYAKLVSMQFSE